MLSKVIILKINSGFDLHYSFLLRQRSKEAKTVAFFSEPLTMNLTSLLMLMMA